MKKINAFFWVKIAIALALAIGIPAIGIAEEVYMRGAFDGVAEDCEEIVALIEQGDSDGAASLAEALRSDWSQKRDMLEFIYPNADVKELQPQIGELRTDRRPQSGLGRRRDRPSQDDRRPCRKQQKPARVQVEKHPLTISIEVNNKHGHENSCP